MAEGNHRRAPWAQRSLLTPEVIKPPKSAWESMAPFTNFIKKHQKIPIVTILFALWIYMVLSIH